MCLSAWHALKPPKILPTAPPSEHHDEQAQRATAVGFPGQGVNLTGTVQVIHPEVIARVYRAIHSVHLSDGA